MKKIILTYVMWIVAVMCLAYSTWLAPISAKDGWYSSLEFFSFLLALANFSGGFVILITEYRQYRYICQKCGKSLRSSYASDKCHCGQ